MSLITQAMIIQNDIQLDYMLMHGGKNHFKPLILFFQIRCFKSYNDRRKGNVGGICPFCG